MRSYKIPNKYSILQRHYKTDFYKSHYTFILNNFAAKTSKACRNLLNLHIIMTGMESTDKLMKKITFEINDRLSNLFNQNLIMRTLK